MTGARRGRPEDKSISGRDLWTEEGTNALIRKLQSDPGLTEEFRKQAIESVRSGAVERGIGKAPQAPKPEPIIEMKEDKVTAKSEPSTAVTTPVETAPPTSDTWREFDVYQKFTDTVAVYPPEIGLPYTVTGLAGEASEVAGKLSDLISKTLMGADGLAVDERRDTLFQLNKILKDISKLGAEAEKLKKQLRKGEKKILPLRAATPAEATALAHELGDVLWYCAQVAKELGLPLSQVIKMNIDKLTGRKARGTLHGNGDNR